MIRTHMIRAETSQPMSKDQYRHEANAFWELRTHVKYLSEITDFKGDEMKGHQLRKYGLEVIERLQQLTKKIDDAIEEGKEMKADGYVYENYELTKKEVKQWKNQKTANTARNKRYYTVLGWPTISYVGIVIGNGGEINEIRNNNFWWWLETNVKE